MTFELIDATTIIRQNLHRRQNFCLIENEIWEFLNSAEAETDSQVSGAKLSNIYQHLRFALPKLGFKPLHLRIQGTSEQTAWERLCSLTRCASATLAKALSFLEKHGLIQRDNCDGLIIIFSLPANSFRQPTKITAPLPTSPTAGATSFSEALSNERKEQNIKAEPPASTGGLIQTAITQSEERITKMFWDMLDDLYALQIRHNAQAARVGAATAIRMLGKSPKQSFNSPPESNSLAESTQLLITEAQSYPTYQAWEQYIQQCGYDLTQPHWVKIKETVKANFQKKAGHSEVEIWNPHNSSQFTLARKPSQMAS